jgi:cytochrome c peroxidase
MSFFDGCGSSEDPNQPQTASERTLTPQQLLGKRIFEDPLLSDPAGAACSSCHDPAKAYTGDNGSHVAGVPMTADGTTFGLHNTPTLDYLAYGSLFTFVVTMTGTGQFEETPTGGFYLDGSAATLYDQANAAFTNAREMHIPDSATLTARLTTAPYSVLFRQVYGQDVLGNADVTYDFAADAIVAYERTSLFAPFTSKFDAMLAGKATLTDQERQGFTLFTDPTTGNCVSCHAGDTTSNDPAAWQFTNFTYGALGAPRNAAIPENADPGFFDLGLCSQPGLDLRAPFGFNLDTLCGGFRVPTLRNVGVTAPYMHNGSIASLRDAVKFHVTRNSNPELWYPTNPDGSVAFANDLPEIYQANLTKGVPFDPAPDGSPSLTDAEIDALVAFLQTLTDAPATP